jgi:uncharacterized membrane protein YidH (DUF202 family)
MAHSDDPEDVDPNQARERTKLAWTRTAIAFAAVGGAVLKTNIIAGAIVLALAPLIWLTGYMARGSDSGRARPSELRLIALAVIAVALVVLMIALTGHKPGFHPPAHVQG